MKGIVFTEFLDLVEDKFGLEMVDTIISKSKLESEGVYTSIGTYSFSEMLQLLTHLSNYTEISIDNLLLVYGEHFFSVIERNYPQFLKMYDDPIMMLASIESHIHVEVQKIYPNAELPTFEVLDKTKNSIELLYKSSRAMHYFGMGLINKTFQYFKMTAKIVYDKIKDDGTEVKISITNIHE